MEVLGRARAGSTVGHRLGTVLCLWALWETIPSTWLFEVRAHAKSALIFTSAISEI